MEEKDVKFNLVRLTDNEETKQIAVTSDIDDFPDYLDVDDCIAIISSLTSKCVSHLMGTDDDDYNIDKRVTSLETTVRVLKWTTTTLLVIIPILITLNIIH